MTNAINTVCMIPAPRINKFKKLDKSQLSKMFYGKAIKNTIFNKRKNKIFLYFDNLVLQISDDMQICCEYRYITMDDDISDLIGDSLKEIIVKPAEATIPDESIGIEIHETMFVEIATNKNSIVFCTHNEHNGYYGGFNLNLEFFTYNKEYNINPYSQIETNIQ